MYQHYFGMRELPFTIMPNTEFYVNLPGHQSALQQIRAHLEKGQVFIKITGDIGTGKTMLCRQLIRRFPRSWVALYVPNPLVSPLGMIQDIAMQLGIDADVEHGYYYIQNLIRLELKQMKKQSRRVVLFLDEAQAMTEETLNALVTMAYLDHQSGKLLQLVLLGQPEFDDMLRRLPWLEKFSEKIGLECTLPRLKPMQSTGYINHRLSCAGYEGGKLFTRKALRLISKAANGVPRNVNNLCHASLMLSFEEEKKQVTDKEVQQVLSAENRLKNSAVSGYLSSYRHQLYTWLLLAGVALLSLMYLLV